MRRSSPAGRHEFSAHAKLNLGLSAVGRRHDGFHDIETLFVRLELHDELVVEPATELKGEVAAETGIQLEGLALDGDNLVVRAVEAYREAASEERGVRLRLLKRIPLSAGLGGGSSDAAQALLAMERLYPAAVDLQALALDLGSDVPFFLSGLRAAWGRGRGEVLEAADLPSLEVVLANPGVGVSAADAYGLLDGLDEPIEREALLASLGSGNEPGYRNSLQAGVVEEYPVIDEVLEALRDSGLRGVLMSGSGATCFGLAHSSEEARRIAQRLQEQHPKWWLWSGSTLS